MSQPTIQHGGEKVSLPREVIEQATAKTSVYTQGKLVYDGATGQPAPDAHSGNVPAGASLNEFLRWGVSNSDPAELRRRAEAGGVAPPSQLDREIMDMLLGEPTVAKMRDCLAAVSAETLGQDGALDAALAKLEELEYYVEDIDNAVDFAKIGGLQAMLYLLGRGCALDDNELREAGCGVLAAAMQNNPKVQDAALALDIPAALLELVTLIASHRPDGALPARQKALLALSALMRGSAAAAAAVLALPAALPTLVELCTEADSKLRRRALFLLSALVRDGTLHAAALADLPTAVPAFLQAATSGDEDTRHAGLQMLQLVHGCPAAAEQLSLAEPLATLQACLKEAELRAGGAEEEGGAVCFAEEVEWIRHVLEAVQK